MVNWLMANWGRVQIDHFRVIRILSINFEEKCNRGKQETGMNKSLKKCRKMSMKSYKK